MDVHWLREDYFSHIYLQTRDDKMEESISSIYMNVLGQLQGLEIGVIVEENYYGVEYMLQTSE